MKKNNLFKFLTIFILLIISALVYYYFFKYHGFSIPCLFHELTGLHCSGCGVTRLLFSLMNLEFYQAFRYNPLAFILLPFFLFFLGDYVIKNIKMNNNYIYKRVNNKIWIVLLVIALLFGVLRNIPGFEVLKPTDIM